MENKSNKVFLNGIISKEVPETAPDFILGNLSINVNDLISWLMDARTKDYCKNGWINAQIKRGLPKGDEPGKRYIEVDTWQPSPRGDTSAPRAHITGGQGMAEVARDFKNGEVDPNSVPF